MPDRRRPVSRKVKAEPSPQGSESEKGVPLVAKFAFRPVTTANLADFETFFSSRGAPKHCWCMVWRRSPAEAKNHDPASRRRQMMARLADGVPIGLLAL